MEPASLAQLGAPVLFRTDYKREGGLRAGYGEKQDAQATAFFVAFVDNATASQLRPDSEVADYRWKTLRELDADARAAARGTLGFATAFCNEPIRRLLVLGLKRLRARLDSRALDLRKWCCSTWHHRGLARRRAPGPVGDACSSSTCNQPPAFALRSTGRGRARRSPPLCERRRRSVPASSSFCSFVAGL